MEAQPGDIRDQQKASWDKFSSGWKKWEKILMEFHAPIGDEMIRLINPEPGDFLLDVAAGTGEPGFTIATRYPESKVIITDLSDEMLDIARELATQRGITNVSFQACDASELPFADNTFDGISCRMGLMFFPDMLMAVHEMVRVLKPGGRIAASVWNVPEKNFWITVTAETINRNMQLPPLPPGAPGIFRCAQHGLVEDLFRVAGLTNTTETQTDGRLITGTAEVYWNLITEVAAPFVAALNQADDAMRAKIRQEVIDQVYEKFPHGNVKLPSSALVIYGEK